MDPTPRRQASIEDIEEIWQAADVVIEAAREIALQPESSKTLRTFTMTEVCSLLDLHPTVFYELIRQHPELGGTKTAAKRLFTLAEIHRLQGHLKKLPRQMYDVDRAVTISVANFKGGVAKTFTTVTLAQYFAMRGYRTLVIDTDPQGSLSTTFGLKPTEIDDWKTVLPYFYGRAMVEAEGNEWPKSFAESVQPTYWTGLDIVGANLNLYSGEFVLGMRRNTDPEFRFHTPLDEALEDVRGQYDVILIDNPPALSLSTAAAIFAADGLVIPCPPEALDFESARAFIKLAAEILRAVRSGFNTSKEFEFLRVLITKYNGLPAHQFMAQRMLDVFKDRCVEVPMLQSAAVQSLGTELKTLYEADPTAKGRAVLKRAVESANAVNAVIEQDVISIFQARQRQRLDKQAAA